MAFRTKDLGFICATIALFGLGSLGLAACTPENRDFGSGGSGGSGGGTSCEPNTTESCYDGPAGTEDVGICKTGTHKCLPDGSGYGPCEGQVVPQPESCATPEDEACNGNPPMECPPFSHIFSKTFGDGGEQGITNVAIDPTNGDIVVGGYFNGAIDFGGGLMASTGSDDIFVARFDAAGNHLWSHRYGDASSQRANAVAIDPQGKIYLGGSVSGSVDFGNGPMTAIGGSDAFLLQLDSAGNTLNAKLFGDMGDAELIRIAISKSSQIVLAGNYTSSIKFGGPSFTSMGSYDVFVARLDTSLFHAASRSFGGQGFDELKGLAIDDLDSILITGSFETSIDFGSGAPLTSAGSDDVFIAKLNSTGAAIWSKSWGDLQSQSGLDVITMPNGDIALGGTMKGTINFGQGPLSAPSSGTSLYLSRLTADGTVVWAKIFGGPNTSSTGISLRVDPKASHIVAAGFFNDTIDFGGGPFTGQGLVNPFIARFAFDGAHVASLAYPTTTLAGFLALELMPNGDEILGGVHYGPVDFGGGELTTPTGSDPNALLVRLTP